MTLTPKNWGDFQHYKDRAPAWIKLHRGLLDDFDYARLPVASRALAPLLWLLASEYPKGEITASPEEMAFRFRMSDRDLVAALKPLTEKGFFIDDSGALADCKHDAIPEREEEKEEQVKTEKNIRAVADATRPDFEGSFDEFWEAYPSRGDAANPKKPAKDRFVKLCKSGTDPTAIIAGAKRYAEIERGAGRLRTDKIAQAITWLNQSRWQDYAQNAPADSPAPGYYAPALSMEIEAWDAYRKKTEGKAYPRDSKGGWQFPSQWPPDVQEHAA